MKRILRRKGLEREEKEIAGAGEIVSIAGIKDGGVNVTLVHPDGWGDAGPQPLPVRKCSIQLSEAKIHIFYRLPQLIPRQFQYTYIPMTLL